MAQLSRISLVSLLALGIAMPAFAQQTVQAVTSPQASEPPAEDSEASRDVVVVTANKREESVQDIAVAVTAVTSELRDELGINTVTDLTDVTPGLSYRASDERVFLRGIGRNTNNFGAEPGVANYTDGVYTSFATTAGRDNLFTDRIEVLRGPQGTLYGRNSIGGAINIISKRPTDEFKGEFRLGYADYDYMKVGASVSGPIAGDWLRGRLAANRESRADGFYYNRGTGGTEGYALDNYIIEGQLEGDIGERLHWWTKYTTGRYDNAGPPGGRTGPSSAAPYNQNFVGLITPNPGWAFGPDTSIISYTQDGSTTENPVVLGSNDLNDSYARRSYLTASDDFALEVVYEAGPFDIKYVGGYVYYNYNLDLDADGTPVKSVTYDAITGIQPFCFTNTPALDPIQGWYGWPSSTFSTTPSFCYTRGQRTIYPDLTYHYNENRAFFSNEINFISTHDGPLQWIAGLYAYQENFEQPITTALPNEPTAAIRQLAGATSADRAQNVFYPNPGNVLAYTNNKGNNNAYGAFVQFDYTFNDEWKATLGLRYSLDNKHIQEEGALTCFLICNSPIAYGGYGGLASNLIDITPRVWNGKALIEDPNNPGQTIEDPTPQKGVTSATIANPSGVTYDPVTGRASRTLAAEWDAFTGSAGLEWRPNADTLFFGKYSRGYKTGAFNADSLAPSPYTNPEYVDAFELGWKQEWDSLKLTTNAAAFLYNYKDVQTPLTTILNSGEVGETSITALRSLPKVETTGFELESTWRPLDDLTIRASYAWLRPEVKESGNYLNSLVARNVVKTDDPAYVDPVQSVEGNVLPQSPENKFSFSASYYFGFADGSSWLPVVSYSWRDGFANDIFNNPNEQTPSFDKTDLRLMYNDASGMFTVIGFVSNVFDQDGYDSLTTSYRANPEAGTAACTPFATCFDPTQNVSATNVSGNYYKNFILRAPRMWGVELQVHF